MPTLQDRRTLLIGIAGGSGSGKTTFARDLQLKAGKDRVSILSMDAYFQTQESADTTYLNLDHPSHLDLDLMLADLDQLRSGKRVLAPSYDFRTMQQTPKCVPIEASPVVLVEGLFVLGLPFATRFDLTCFLDVSDDQRLLGRILRDRKERGAKLEEIVDRYQRFVRPSYHIFVAPAKQNADIVVDFTYRRALLSQMFAHLIMDYVAGSLDIDTLIADIRKESYMRGVRQEDGAMPMTIDIRELARAYPEKMALDTAPASIGTPTLFIHEDGT